MNTIKAFLVACAIPCMAWAYSAQEMTLEEKVGQLFMVHFHGEEANEEAELLVQRLHVGGFIYYNWANQLSSPEQVSRLSRSLQKLAEKNRLSIPLFIAVDQEGGIVNRLSKGFTVFPGNKALGMTGDPEWAARAAFAMGKELKAVGVNMNLAPVVDSNSNPRNPVIGLRSYGETADAVISYGKKALMGYQEAGIITCLKHFPGHGDTEVDSHEGLPVIKKSKEQLAREELRPFYELYPLADTVMTAHLLAPALDPAHCTTLSKESIDLLREKGFNGVVVADSLIMEGVRQTCGSIEETAMRALKAGCDLLLLGGKQLIGAHASLELTVADVERVHKALVQAVRQEDILEQRVDQAVERILALKKRMLFPPSQKIEEATWQKDVGTLEHKEMAETIARLALRVQKKQSLPENFQKSSLLVIAPELIREEMQGRSLPAFLKEKKEDTLLYFKELIPTENDKKAALAKAKAADLIVFFSYNAWRFEEQGALMQSLIDTGKPFVLVVARDPLDASLPYDEKVSMVITTFSSVSCSLQAAWEALQKEG